MGLKGKAPFVKGKAILAAWLVAMWEAIQANEIIVDPSSGLQALATPNGKQLTLVRDPGPCRAIVTTAISAPASATATHTLAAGWGFAQPQRFDLALNKYVDSGPIVRVINPWPNSATTATAGKVIWIVYANGCWQMIGENC